MRLSRPGSDRNPARRPDLQPGRTLRNIEYQRTVRRKLPQGISAEPTWDGFMAFTHIHRPTDPPMRPPTSAATIPHSQQGALAQDRTKLDPQIKRLQRAFCRQKHRRRKTKPEIGPEGHESRPGAQGKRPKGATTNRNSGALPRPKGDLHQSPYRSLRLRVSITAFDITTAVIEVFVPVGVPRHPHQGGPK